MIMFQDNMSAMLLEKHRCRLITQRKKHIRVRYFLIKERIGVGDLKVKHCPMDEILMDHFTKNL